jgi:hypothetical protein
VSSLAEKGRSYIELCNNDVGKLTVSLNTGILFRVKLRSALNDPRTQIKSVDVTLKRCVISIQ